MLIVSRETGVIVGKHAWHVYPLEAFGYLLGGAKAQLILAALPCSKTKVRCGTSTTTAGPVSRRISIRPGLWAKHSI